MVLGQQYNTQLVPIKRETQGIANVMLTFITLHGGIALGINYFGGLISSIYFFTDHVISESISPI